MQRSHCKNYQDKFFCICGAVIFHKHSPKLESFIKNILLSSAKTVPKNDAVFFVAKSLGLCNFILNVSLD